MKLQVTELKAVGNGSNADVPSQALGSASASEDPEGH